jgi:hypothetical protein
MAIQLKQLLQVNKEADRLYSTDKTGAYVASYNETGYGAPNIELDEHALLFIAQRIDKETTVLEAVGNSLLFNASANNDQENVVEFIFKTDGHHRVTLLALPASLDGTTLETGDPIEADLYYYYSGNVYFVGDDGPEVVPIADYVDLIGDPGVIQDYAENIFYPNKMLSLNDLYAKARDARNCKHNDYDFLMRQFESLRWDLESAYNQFWSGLTMEAVSLVNSLNNRYDGKSA